MSTSQSSVAQRISVAIEEDNRVQIIGAIAAGLIALLLARFTGIVLSAYIVCGVLVFAILAIKEVNWIVSLILGIVVATVLMFLMVPIIDQMAKYRLYFLIGAVVWIFMRQK